jgi:hypothetical protein
VKHPNFGSHHSISFFSRFVFDESLPKGESMGTKLVGLFANMVVERRNMIIYIYGGEFALRVLGGVDSGGVFELCELLYF